MILNSESFLTVIISIDVEFFEVNKILISTSCPNNEYYTINEMMLTKRFLMDYQVVSYILHSYDVCSYGIMKRNAACVL